MALEYRAFLFYGNHKDLSYRLIISVVWRPTLQLLDCYVYKTFSEFNDTLCYFPPQSQIQGESE